MVLNLIKKDTLFLIVDSSYHMYSLVTGANY